MSTLSVAALVMVAAVLLVPLFKKLKLGTILGYLVAGVVVGPSGLGLVHDVEDIMHFSEFGVVLFLFLVGLELEPARLWALRRSVFGLGTAQMVLSGLLLALGGVALMIPFATAAVVGLSLALSSTAIGLAMLSERGQLTSAIGRAAFAILLFQDIAVIPLLAVIPSLSGTHVEDVPLVARMTGAAKVLLVVCVVVVAGRYLVRPLFHFIARVKATEVFTPAALLVVVGTAALMQVVDISMALGAFLAGVLLAESEYRHELEADIEPFKGLLLGLFFMAVGMGANVQLLLDRPVAVLLTVAVMLLAKTGVLMLLGRRLGLSLRGGVTLALCLAQGGEFAFVVFGITQQAGLVSRDITEFLVVVVSVSMAASPLLMAALDGWLRREPTSGSAREHDVPDAHTGHIIIAGLGRFGQIVGRVLNACHIPFTALEASAEQVDFLRKFGNRVFFGDASRLDLLRAARAEDARAFVLAIDDPEASVRTAQVMKKAFPSVPIYARARNRQHAYRLMSLDVRLVERELFLGSLDMASHVLQEVGYSPTHARDIVERFRVADEDMLRRQHAVHTDETALIQTAAQVGGELRALFEQDVMERVLGNAPPPAPAADAPVPPPAATGSEPPP